MSVREKIEADLKQAMLKRDDIAKNALRMMKSDILLREVELGRPLEDKEAFAVLKKIVNSRKDALEQYRASGREDIVETEEKELVIIEAFLPKGLSEDDLRKAVAAVVTELGASTKKDTGKVMKELQARHENLDGKLAGKFVGELLK